MIRNFQTLYYINDQESKNILVSWASPFTRKEVSGLVPLLELFFSSEILGNMNMQILWPQYDRYTRKRKSQLCSPGRQVQNRLRAGHVQWLACHHKVKNMRRNTQNVRIC